MLSIIAENLFVNTLVVDALTSTMSQEAVVGALELRKNWGSHIDASHSRQPLVKGERLVRHEVNAVMPGCMAGNNIT